MNGVEERLGVRICRIVESHVDAVVIEVEGTVLWLG